MLRFVTASLACVLFLSAGSVPTIAADEAGDATAKIQPFFSDDFQGPRSNKDSAKNDVEKLGNGWTTNSRSRAKGNRQVDLVDGAMHIYRHAVADHGVSVVHDLGFRDGEIRMRFKLGDQDDLGINIADMDEKSVHAGHLCMARIRNHQAELLDLKTGRMKLEIRQANKSKSLTPEQKALIQAKSKKVKLDLTADQWHELSVKINGDTMTVSIDGQSIGTFASPGIAHPTKKRLRLAVNREAWIDDVQLFRH